MKKKNLLRIAKEFVALSSIVELVLATYIGFQFGVGQQLRGWLFTVILAVISYVSTRAWIWYFDARMKGEGDAGTKEG
jgi:hypothetical protein